MEIHLCSEYFGTHLYKLCAKTTWVGWEQRSGATWHESKHCYSSKSALRCQAQEIQRCLLDTQVLNGWNQCACIQIPCYVLLCLPCNEKGKMYFVTVMTCLKKPICLCHILNLQLTNTGSRQLLNCIGIVREFCTD